MNRRNFLSKLGLTALAGTFAVKAVAEPKAKMSEGLTLEQLNEALRKLTERVNSLDSPRVQIDEPSFEDRLRQIKDDSRRRLYGIMDHKPYSIDE
jgi:hypothetical protein